MEAKAYGTGSGRFRSVSGMASWGIGVWAEAEELCLTVCRKRNIARRCKAPCQRKLTDGQLFVVSNPVPGPAQDQVAGQGLGAIRPQERRLLVIAGDGQEGLTQAARNLPKVNVVTPDRLERLRHRARGHDRDS